jgi:putative polyketide hydroxylase
MHHFLQPGEEPKDFPASRLQAMIRDASGLPAEPVEVLSVMPWVMSPKVARRYRIGRIFLVGDAAARLSPAGGLGLNTGLQSAHNLAWKLAYVINGEAEDSLLDTYQEERRDTALWTMENTNRNADEIFSVVASAMENNWDKVRDLIAQSRRRGAGLGQDLGIAYSRGAFLPDGSEPLPVVDPINDYKPSGRPGSRAPHLWIERQGTNLSTLDLLGTQFVLLTGKDYHPAELEKTSNAAGACPIVILQDGRDFASDGFEELYGISSGGAVLVRPDGYIGARWTKPSPNFSDQFQSAFTPILRSTLSV